MSICNRCGLNLAYSSIHQFGSRKNKEELKIEYESLNEEEHFVFSYGVETTTGSSFPSHIMDFNGNIRSIKEFKEKFPWINDENANVEPFYTRVFGHLCDECLQEMLMNKELLNDNVIGLLAPFYTSCCDKLFPEIPIDEKDLYYVEEINLFPYQSYLKIGNARDTHYMIYENLSFSLYEMCLICKDCLGKYKLFKYIEKIEKNHPCYFSLEVLRSILNEFKNYGNIPRHHYDLFPMTESNAKYFYSSKKNNLLLKKELDIFFAKRNLSLLKKHFPISKDVISCILKYIVS